VSVGEKTVVNTAHFTNDINMLPNGLHEKQRIFFCSWRQTGCFFHDSFIILSDVRWKRMVSREVVGVAIFPKSHEIDFLIS
jgi:hypothetical protein